MKHGACMAKYQIVINLCPNRLIGSAAQIESCCLIADIHDGIIVDLNIILPPMSTEVPFFVQPADRQALQFALVSTPTNDWIRAAFRSTVMCSAIKTNHFVRKAFHVIVIDFVIIAVDPEPAAPGVTPSPIRWLP